MFLICNVIKLQNENSTSQSKLAHPRTDAPLPLCTTTELFWNRYALEFGSLDASLIRQAKSRIIAEMPGPKTRDVSIPMGQNRYV